MSKIVIRRATVDDLPWIRHLVSEFIADPSQAQMYPAMDAEELDAFTLLAYRSLEHNPHFSAWIAWKGKRAVGVLGGEIQERQIGKPHRFANALFAFVEASHRSSDVGFRMTEAFATWAQEQGIDMMECRAVAGDTRYADNGYPLVSTCYAAPIAQVLDTWRAKA